MLPRTAKLTSKNQLTLPKRVVEALGWPTHFRVQVEQGVLVLWPGRVVTGEQGPAGGDAGERGTGSGRK